VTPLTTIHHCCTRAGGLIDVRVRGQRATHEDKIMLGVPFHLIDLSIGS
jgi:hypothetical protein